MRRNIQIRFLLIVLVSVLVFSCRPKYSPKPVYTVFNDFENVAGWINNPTNNSNAIAAGKAHSGNYAYKIDKDHGFGYYYKSKFSDITNKKINWIKISGYCNSKTKHLKKASVACTLQDEKDQYLKWSEAFLDEFIDGKADKWIYFEKSFDVSAQMKPEVFISAFVWSSDSSDEVLIDDFKIEFFD